MRWAAAPPLIPKGDTNTQAGHAGVSRLERTTRMTNTDDYARAIIAEGQTARTAGKDYLQHPVITARGIKIALATAYVESNFVMYANNSDPDSLNYPHQAISLDADSDG